MQTGPSPLCEEAQKRFKEFHASPALTLIETNDTNSIDRLLEVSETATPTALNH